MAGSSLFRVGDDVAFSRVLQHLSVLVLFVIAFERGLHTLEHRLRRSPKYREILSKTYRELMILGFVGLGIKAFKETARTHASGDDFAAFNIADLTIFILALALIVQALVVFLRLGRHNRLIDRVELVTTSDLVDTAVRRAETAKNQPRVTRCLRLISSSRAKHAELFGPQLFSQEIEELRVLRHLFLRRYSLPQLFPFGQYIRGAQDSQITHMIDVEPSTWFLLIAVAWGLEGALAGVRSVAGGESEPHTLVFVFVAFAWALVGGHCAVAYYFRLCLLQLLASAGYGASTVDRIATLRRIGEEEKHAWAHELAVDALEAMQRVQEKEEARQLKMKYRRHHLVEADTGLQLIATCFRHARNLLFVEREYAASSGSVSSADSLQGAESSPSRRREQQYSSQQEQQRHHYHALTPIEIRWFSRKAWHFIVIFLLMLNGFYLALLCQCILYQLGAVQEEFGWGVTLLIPLPLALNTVVLQPRIFRSFMIVCSIFRVHTKALTEAIAHFREIVELRSEFARLLSEGMERSSLTVADLERALAARDAEHTGVIEIEKLRAVLRSFGLRLSLSRFNSVARLIFKVSGMQIKYAQVIRLASVSREADFEDAGSDVALVHELLLTAAGVTHATETAHAPNGKAKIAQSHLPTQRHLLSRNGSQLLGASSRAVRRLYHIDSLRFDGTMDASSEAHYVQM